MLMAAQRIERIFMRVCVVTEAGYVHGIGGMQEHTSNLVRGLVAAGHEVEVITGPHPDGLTDATYDGGTWHFVDAPTTRPGLPMRNPEWHRRTALRFQQLHDQKPFDVVHSESTSALGLLHRRLHRLVPTVAKFHGNYLGHVRENIRRARTRGDVVREAKSLIWTTGKHFLSRGNWHLFRDCEAMVPSRAQLDDTCRSHLLKRSRVHIVANGIDTDLFAPGSRDEARRELGLGPEPIFVSVGRLNREKGVRHLIAALARVPGDARLLIVGDGEERQALELRVHDEGVADRVTFVGAVQREGVASYLRAADVFVFPTEHPEAAPLVLPEAMSVGLPVVASRVGAIPEVVGDGATALLVPPGDPEALADGMRSLVESPERRRQMSEASRRRILDEFTLERMISRTVDVYEIARRGHASGDGHGSNGRR
jgi:glycosyltransferase involved in cell wall biosynthesis